MGGKTGIERRIFLLLLATGLVSFLAFETVSFFGLYGVQTQALESGTKMGESAAAFAEAIADEQAKKRFALFAEEKARGIETDMRRLKEDTKLLAKSMTRILTHKGEYSPRSLPVVGEVPIRSKEPYLFFVSALRESGGIEEVLSEARIASNVADNLALWAECIDDGYDLTYYFASKRGYIIGVDATSKDAEFVEFDEGWYAPSFDPRERPWYQEIEATGKTVFTDVYVGVEGYPVISCVAPYYDENGFAGVASISPSIALLYRVIAVNTLGYHGINFILNSQGEVLLSSETSGPLAPSEPKIDLRKYEDADFALAADGMARGLSDVSLVTLGGKEYYLAYAPIESLGWSFGTLIERDVVVQPARDAKAYLLSRAADFSASLQDFFWDNLLRTAALLLALLAVLFFASRKAADRFVKPVLALTAGVREISGGNLDKKIEVRTGDEVETLAESFNQMTDKLKSYIENLAKTTAEKERIETELSVAARIQAGILPRNFPARGEFDLFASMDPAKEVGGDFYDFYFLDERHLVVTVADVSDKGVHAALFMVAAKTLLKESVLTMGPVDNLPAAVARTNDRLTEANDEGMFVTVFTGILDIRNGDFTYVNAGHNPPLLRRNGNFEFLPIAAGPMLGAMGGMTFPAVRLTLSAGDMLFLYTDGVTEAMNEAREMFTEKRLKKTLSDRAVGKSSAEVLAAVREAVSAHAGGAEQSDDITMLGLIYNGGKDVPPHP